MLTSLLQFPFIGTDRVFTMFKLHYLSFLFSFSRIEELETKVKNNPSDAPRFPFFPRPIDKSRKARKWMGAFMKARANSK